jgi:hypothetical protein
VPPAISPAAVISVRREQAERLLDAVRVDEPELAERLRIEPVELDGEIENRKPPWVFGEVEAARLLARWVRSSWGRRHAAVAYGPVPTSAPRRSPHPPQRSAGAHIVT